jgi:hypothetical protein
MALRHRDVRACTPSRYHSVGLCRNQLCSSEWFPSCPQTSFRGSHLSRDPKDGSRKEPDLSCKVDEAGQSTKTLWWLLEYEDLSVASHCRGEEAFLLHFMGMNPLPPSGNAFSELCFGTHVAHRLHFERSRLRYYLAGNIATTCKNAE